MAALGIHSQARLRPVYSDLNGSTTFGVGVTYGFGIGSARLSGISYSIWDTTNQFDMGAYPFQARLVAINGQHRSGAHTFDISDDLSQYDVLYDVILREPGPTELQTWFSGIVTDEGSPLTVMISQVLFLAGAPPGIIPQTNLLVHADTFKTKELALSPGPIQTL
jgi:hypothetical protein